MNKKLLEQPSNSTIKLFIIFGCLVVSIWSVYADPIINIDGILYADAANSYLTHGFSETLSVYKWPLYPILMALIHQITGLSLVNSAHLLTYVFSVLTSFAFIGCISILVAVNNNYNRCNHYCIFSRFKRNTVIFDSRPCLFGFLSIILILLITSTEIQQCPFSG